MRTLRVVVGGVLSLGVLATLIGFSVLAKGPAGREDEAREARDAPLACAYPIKDAMLEISECSHGRISGSHEHAGSVVTFSSRLADNWSGPSPSRKSLEGDPPGAAPWVTSRIEVNGKVFNWTNDTKRRLGRFDGPDKALTRKDSEALIGAGDAVWSHLLHGEPGSQARKDKLTWEQVWLTVALGYISEAPAGYEITDKTFSTTITGQEKSPRGDGGRFPRRDGGRQVAEP